MAIREGFLPDHLHKASRLNKWSLDEQASAYHNYRLRGYDEGITNIPTLSDTRKELGFDDRSSIEGFFDSSISGLSDLVFDAPKRVVGGTLSLLGDITGSEGLQEVGRDTSLSGARDPNPTEGMAGLLGQVPAEIAKIGLAFIPFIGKAGRVALLRGGGKSFIDGSTAKKAAALMGATMIPSEYGRFRHIEDVEPSRAAVGATLMTAAEFFSDRLTLGALSTGKMLNSRYFQQMMKQKLGAIGARKGTTSYLLSVASTGAVTEATTEFLQGGINEGIINPEAKLGDILDAAANPEQIAKGAFLGAIVGGSVAGINHGIASYLEANYPDRYGPATENERDIDDNLPSKYEQTRNIRHSEYAADQEKGGIDRFVDYLKMDSDQRAALHQRKKVDMLVSTGAFNPNIDIQRQKRIDTSEFKEDSHKYTPERPKEGYFAQSQLKDSLSKVVGSNIITAPDRSYLTDRYTHKKDKTSGALKEKKSTGNIELDKLESNVLHTTTQQSMSEVNKQFFNRVATTPTPNKKHTDLKDFLRNYLPQTLKDELPNTRVDSFMDISIRRPDIAKKLAPNSYHLVESYMKVDKQIGKELMDYQQHSFQYEKQPLFYKDETKLGSPTLKMQTSIPHYIRKYWNYLTKSDVGDKNPFIDDLKKIGTKFAHSISRRNLFKDIEKGYNVVDAEAQANMLNSVARLVNTIWTYGATTYDEKGWRDDLVVYRDGKPDSMIRIEEELYDTIVEHFGLQDNRSLALEIHHNTLEALAIDSFNISINKQSFKDMLEKSGVNLDKFKNLVVKENVLPEKMRDIFGQRIHMQFNRLLNQSVKYGRFSSDIKDQLDKSGYRLGFPLLTNKQIEQDPSIFGFVGLPNPLMQVDYGNVSSVPDPFTSSRELASRLVYSAPMWKLTQDLIKKLMELGPTEYTIIRSGARQNKPSAPEGSIVISYNGHLGKIDKHGNPFDVPTNAQVKNNQPTQHYWITIHNKDFIEAFKALPRAHFSSFFIGATKVRMGMTGMITSAPKFITTAFLRSIPEAYATAPSNNYEFARGFEVIKNLTKDQYNRMKRAWDTEGDPALELYRKLAYSGQPYGGVLATNIGSEVNTADFALGGLSWNPNKPLASLGRSYMIGLNYLTAHGQIAEAIPKMAEAMAAHDRGLSNLQIGNLAAQTATDFADKPTNEFLRKLTTLFLFMGAQINSTNRWGNVLLTDHNHNLNIMDVFTTKNDLEGLSAEAREHIELKKRAYMVGGAMAAAAIMIYAWNNADDERKEKYENLSAFDKARYLNIFIGDEHIKLPIVHELAFLMVAPTTAALDIIFQNQDREVIKTFSEAWSMSFGLERIPSALQPLYQSITNRRFSGAKLIPDYMADREAQHQYFSHTSILYKKLGEYLNVSPLQAENLINGYTGYVSDIVEAGAELIAWDPDKSGAKPFDDLLLEISGIGGFIRNQRQSTNRWTRDFSFMLDRAQSAKQAIDNMEEEYRNHGVKPDPEIYDKYKKLSYILKFFQSTLSETARANKAVFNITHDKSLSKSDKEDQIISIYNRLNARKETSYKKAMEHLEHLEQYIFSIDNYNWTENQK